MIGQAVYDYWADQALFGYNSNVLPGLKVIWDYKPVKCQKEY